MPQVSSPKQCSTKGQKTGPYLSLVGTCFFVKSEGGDLFWGGTCFLLFGEIRGEGGPVFCCLREGGTCFKRVSQFGEVTFSGDGGQFWGKILKKNKDLLQTACKN